LIQVADFRLEPEPQLLKLVIRGVTTIDRHGREAQIDRRAGHPGLKPASQATMISDYLPAFLITTLSSILLTLLTGVSAALQNPKSDILLTCARTLNLIIYILYAYTYLFFRFHRLSPLMTVENIKRRMFPVYLSLAGLTVLSYCGCSVILFSSVFVLLYYAILFIHLIDLAAGSLARRGLSNTTNGAHFLDDFNFVFAFFGVLGVVLALATASYVTDKSFVPRLLLVASHFIILVPLAISAWLQYANSK
jgi:hypothetical protein